MRTSQQGYYRLHSDRSGGRRTLDSALCRSVGRLFVVLKPLCAVTDLLHYREPILQRSSKDKTGCWLVSCGVCLGIWEGSQRRGPGEQHTFAVRLVASVYKTHTVLCKLLDRVHDWINRLHGSSSSSFFGFLSTPQLTTHKTPSLSQNHRYTTKKNPKQ